MEKYFSGNEWSDEVVLKKIKALLVEHKSAKYKIVVGHHPIAHLCGETYGLAKI